MKIFGYISSDYFCCASYIGVWVGVILQILWLSPLLLFQVPDTLTPTIEFFFGGGVFDY